MVLDHTYSVNYYFEEIAKIPHGSYHEEQIADYIVSIAKGHNLRYIRDESHNVIVFKAIFREFNNIIYCINEFTNH